MSRLERPLLAKALPLMGDIALRAEVTLRIKTNLQSWEPVNFLVDPGTEMTTLPAARSKQLGIPFPQKPVPRLGITGKSAEVRAGFIRARVDGMDPTEYVFPCYFIGDPDALFGTPLMVTADHVKFYSGRAGVCSQSWTGFGAFSRLRAARCGEAW